MQIVLNSESNVDDSLEIPCKTNKRKRTNESQNLSELLQLKKEEYRKRDERHKDKIAIEERKMSLLEKILDKK